MEEISVYINELIAATGLTGSVCVVLRYTLLIVVTVLLAWLSDRVCQKVIVPSLVKITKKTDVKWDDVIFNEKVFLSACDIIPALIIWTGLPVIFYEFSFVNEMLERATEVYIVVMATRTAIVFINSFNQLDTNKGRSSMQQYMKSFCGVLKIVILFVSFIIIVAFVLGKSPMRLLAGLGATSAILMLVFKDTIEGLVAGIRLTSNDMLHREDWITVPGTAVNGVVKDITLTTVKVQNFDNTIVTISPTALVNGSFTNWIGMQKGTGRRVQRKVYFDFRSIHFIEGETETNMGRFRKDMEQWITDCKYVNSDMLVMVRQIEATQCGVPMEFYFFLKDKEWRTYEHQLAEIMEHVYATAIKYDLKIYEQYPEQ